MSTKEPCRFCGAPLKGRATIDWPGGGTEVDDCTRCGTYKLPLSLLATVVSLSDDARAEVADYLQSLAAEPDATPFEFTPAFFGKAADEA